MDLPILVYISILGWNPLSPLIKCYTLRRKEKRKKKKKALDCEVWIQLALPQKDNKMILLFWKLDTNSRQVSVRSLSLNKLTKAIKVGEKCLIYKSPSTLILHQNSLFHFTSRLLLYHFILLTLSKVSRSSIVPVTFLFDLNCKPFHTFNLFHKSPKRTSYAMLSRGWD